MALTVHGDGDFAVGKRHACRYFAVTELPRVAAWLAPIEAGEGLAATMPEEGF